MARRRKQPAGLVRVELLAPHTHRRTDRAVGETIDLRPDQADQLVRAGKASLLEPILEPVQELSSNE